MLIYETPDRVLTRPMTDTQELYVTDGLGLQIQTTAKLITELDRKAAKRGKQQLHAARRAETDTRSMARTLGKVVEEWRKLEAEWDAFCLADTDRSAQELDERRRKLDVARNKVNDFRQQLADALRRWMEADPRHAVRARVSGYINTLGMAGAWGWEDSDG